MTIDIAATAGRRMQQLVCSRKFIIVAVVAVAIVVALAIVVDPAFASDDIRDRSNGGIGKGFGQMLQEWAKWLIPGAAAIVGVPMLARAEVGPAIMVFFLAMLLGAFAYMDDDTFRLLTKPVLDSLGK